MASERKDIKVLAKRHDKLETLMCYINKEALIKQHEK